MSVKSAIRATKGVLKEFWPFRMRGYEKFWGALLAGGSQIVPINVCLLVVGMVNPAFPTREVMVIATVISAWNTLWAALGAYIPATTVTPAETPAPVEPPAAPSE